ncbi:MAG TPA: replication-associated recombination protein A [Spirochaetota bacterium]|nr:replication-associated recombination protein A [Spirochaetota bacterium]HNU91641.1 replication-associated recombination protein A [Spirochaetota bacterium]HPV98276.1 replication-associated recombination protein A [Spirochaetota bacterium]
MENYRDIRPLAERRRPRTLEAFVGQEHLLGPGRILRSVIDKKTIFSMLLWGEPGCGKTTLARLIAGHCGVEAHFLSAVSSGVPEVRKVIERGKENRKNETQTILFLDEIHRFNKAQQDAVLGAVESGEIVLIGATTENPSFQVIAPLLSRCRVVRLKPLSEKDLMKILDTALEDDAVLAASGARMEAPEKEKLVALAQGDARRMLNVLEQAALLAGDGPIDDRVIAEALRGVVAYYDRAGDRHYDTISAFIKSMRGSDPDAAVYYLARMLVAGEDPVFIARRMVIFASEDVGNASPQALPIAVAAMTAAQNIGPPEAEIILAQCATFLASSPKSNASYMALKKARERADDFSIEIPLHLRNAPTKLMSKMGYGREYRYPHDFEDHFVQERYLPEKLADESYYRPSAQGSEKAIAERLARLWPERFGK